MMEKTLYPSPRDSSRYPACVAVHVRPRAAFTGCSAMKLGPIITLFLLLAVAFSLGGCAPAPGASDKTEAQAIRSLFARYEKAVDKKDADGWIALWHEDAVQLPPDSPMLVGAEAIREANCSRLFDISAGSDIDMGEQEIAVLGNGYGMVRGVYSLKRAAKDGQSGKNVMITDCKFLSVLKKDEHGVWKILNESFSPNGPARVEAVALGPETGIPASKVEVLIGEKPRGRLTASMGVLRAEKPY